MRRPPFHAPFRPRHRPPPKDHEVELSFPEIEEDEEGGDGGDGGDGGNDDDDDDDGTAISLRSPPTRRGLPGAISAHSGFSEAPARFPPALTSPDGGIAPIRLFLLHLLHLLHLVLLLSGALVAADLVAERRDGAVTLGLSVYALMEHQGG